MNPVISIIVPVFNVELYLRNCLDSILAQSFTNIEVILVNDGSKDNSGTICDEYAALDNRVKVVHKGFGGVSSARNAGINLSQGEYIGFVDADDRIDKNMYNELYRLCEKTNSDISICKLGKEINGKLINKVEEDIIKEMDNCEAMMQLFKGILYRFSLCNKLFYKSCFNGVHFPEGRIHEDLSTTYKLFANANKAVFTNFIGYFYVERENSILTTKFSEKRLDAIIGWDEILGFMSENYPHLDSDVIASFTYCCLDNMYYIINQVDNKRDKIKYIRIIQQIVRENYKRIIKNEKLTLNYKYNITLLTFNIRFWIMANFVKNILKK